MIVVLKPTENVALPHPHHQQAAGRVAAAGLTQPATLAVAQLLMATAVPGPVVSGWPGDHLGEIIPVAITVVRLLVKPVP